MRSALHACLLALAGAAAGCHVPPADEVVGGKACDDSGHPCAAGYACCQGACVLPGDACCRSEPDADFCARLGKTCDPVTGADLCGSSRSTNCGACSGPATCGGGGLPNVCGVPGCTSESTAAFCSRLGKACGLVTAADTCGVPRTVSCGTCSTGVCFQNQCCGDSDAAFCARNLKNCGAFSGTDACGQPRTAGCGTCPSPESCTANNTCTCSTESDAAFCTRYGKQCGTYTNTDLCGSARTASCGTCSTPPNTTCSSNACVCTPEADAELCAALRVQCGTATGQDRCGRIRTVACPPCPSPQTCGGGGTSGQCGCIALGAGSCLVTGAACCAGTCNSTGKCCRALGDACTGGISGECCQGVCDATAGTCCKTINQSCTADFQCCSGVCGIDKCQ
ncbi:MAG TPA: hypothetical protein VND93_13105 [Myxococcales bacterium]|nr:hypothetical protein [Myxococcales bacterium]